MSTTVRVLAALVQGELHGDGDLSIQAARPLGEAGPGDITFAESEQFAKQLHSCPATAVVVSHKLPTNGRTVIRVADPLLAFATIVRHLHGRPDTTTPGVDPQTSIHASVCLGLETQIGPFASIGEGTTLGARCRIAAGVRIGRYCTLGEDVVLHANVVLYDETVLGDRVIIHANAVLGADGFGYRFQNGRHAKVPQLGHVEIGEDVEIGACTTIDRATFGVTRIGAGTKIDNQVQIGHNCQIGRHNMLVSQVGIAGSCRTGDYVIMAGQAGIADHVTIGDGVVLGARSGVTNDVPAGQRFLGAPAMPEREQKRILMSLNRLPDMRRDLQRIKQHLGLKDES